MTALSILLVGWCGVLGLIFGCPEQRGPGIVQAQTEMHVLEQQTEQMQIEAQATAEAMRYQTEQQRIAAHATAEALAQREQTYRTEVLQTSATERLYKAEIERTNRLRMFLRFLFYLVFIVAFLYVLTLLASYIVPRQPRVELPLPPDNTHPIQGEELSQFWRATEELPYDIVKYQDGRIFGVLFMNGSPVMRQLPDNVDVQ